MQRVSHAIKALAPQLGIYVGSVPVDPMHKSLSNSLAHTCVCACTMHVYAACMHVFRKCITIRYAVIPFGCMHIV